MKSRARPAALEYGWNGPPRIAPAWTGLPVWLLPALLALGSWSCVQDRASSPPLVIAATTHPMGALAREIAGPEARVLVLLPPGANPHSFEPTPRVVAEGSSASLIIRVGAGLDDWAGPIVQDARRRHAPEIVIVSLVDSLLPAVAEEHEPEPGAPPEPPSGEASRNPHVWLDPLSMLRFPLAVSQELARSDPAHAEAYRERAQAAIDSLRALHVQLARILNPVRNQAFVATHNAWGYLCRRYGLREVDVLQRVPTREPGPRRLAQVMQEAAAQGARAVFTEVQGSSASARTVADELGLRVVQLDPEGTSDDPARDRYFDLLRWNARRIAQALLPPETTP